MSDATIQRYQDIEDRWRWRLVGGDGHPLADGSQAFTDASALSDHLDRLRSVVPSLDIASGGAGVVVRDGDGTVVAIDEYGAIRAKATVDDLDGSMTDIDLPGALERWELDDETTDQWLEDHLDRASDHRAEPGLFINHLGHDDEWRWQLRLDGQLVAESGEGYATQEAATEAAEHTRAAIESADEDTWGTVQNA